jgi:hypothetical protein
MTSFRERDDRALRKVGPAAEPMHGLGSASPTTPAMVRNRRLVISEDYSRVAARCCARKKAD